MRKETRILSPLFVLALFVSSFNFGGFPKIAVAQPPQDAAEIAPSSDTSQGESKIDERRKLRYRDLERRLAVLYPNSKIHLVRMSRKLLVRGQVPEPDEAAHIIAIIRGEVLDLEDFDGPDEDKLVSAFVVNELSTLNADPNVDDDSKQERPVGIIQLKSAKAKDCVALLGKLGVGVEVIVDERTNSLVLMANDGGELAKATDIIRALDEMPPATQTRDTGVSSNPTKSPESVPEIKIFTLENANAGDCVAMLKDVFPEVKLSADKRINSVIAVSSADQLRYIEALLLRLDEHPSIGKQSASQDSSNSNDSTVGDQPRKMGRKPIEMSLSHDARQNPETQKLVEELSRSEANASKLASQIRDSRHQCRSCHQVPEGMLIGPIDFNDRSAHHSVFAQSRKELETALGKALSVKFKLEQLQLNSFENRVALIKSKMAQRSKATKDIIEQRARELLGEDSLKWTPDETPISAAPADPTQARTEDRQILKDPANLNGEVADQFNQRSTSDKSSWNSDLISKLSKMDLDVVDAEVNYARILQMSEAGAVSMTQLKEAKRQVDDAIRNRTLIQEEFSLTVQDLVLQIASAQAEYGLAERSLNRLKSSGVVAERALNDAEKAFQLARYSLERLKLRYEHYKKAGELAGLKIPELPASVKILVAKTSIESGVALGAHNVEMKDWPQDSVPDGAITKEEEFAGHALKIHVVPNMPILSYYLGPKGQVGITALIPAGMQLVTIPVDVSQSHSGLVRPGCYVSISCVVDRPGRDGRPTGHNCRTVLSRVKVIAVGQNLAGSGGANDPNSTKVETISFATYPLQGKLLHMAKVASNGRLQFALLGDDENKNDNEKDIDEETLALNTKEIFGDIGKSDPEVAKPVVTPAENEAPIFWPFGKIEANIKDSPSLLSVKISIQTKTVYAEQVKSALDAKMPILKNWLTGHIADKSLEDVRGKENYDRLRNEIRIQFNTLLFKEGDQRVTDIMLEELQLK